MTNNDVFTMSSQELTRKEVLDRVINREMTQINAAKTLGISDRWLRILISHYKKKGPQALISKKRGKKSNRAYSDDFKRQVIDLVRQKYHDFGPTFAAEKLAERDGLTLSHETLRRWMIDAHLHRPKGQKQVHIHQSRERRACFGELIQIDGSHHDWFEGRAEKCCLLVFIDDATSSLMYCRFEQAETTQGYFRSIKDYIDSYGLPAGLYSDKFSIFRVNQECNEPKGTQFKRAMKELGIDLMCANSPQAKGKVERANLTLQNRLIKEMRLKNISSIDEANTYLPEFIEKYNNKFAKPPKSAVNAHKVCHINSQRLNYILSVRENRRLSKNLECSFHNDLYQITTETRQRRLRYAHVDIATDTNGYVTIWHNNEPLDFSLIKKGLRTPIVNRKTLTQRSTQPKKAWKPGAAHPWRQYRQSQSIKVSQYTQST